MRFTAWFSILVGVLMIGQWSVTLIGGQAPEVQSEPIRLGFHLAAELATALMLVISGIGLLRSRKGSRKYSLVAHGMLFYTMIVSPGYFAQLGQWAPVVMFALLFSLALFSVGLLMKGSAAE